jgi:cyclase
MQSRNFRLQKVGNVNWLEKNYGFRQISFSLDELIVIDASRKSRLISNFSNVLKDVVNEVFIPICAGGGIRTMSDADLLFNSGADKILLNYSLLNEPSLVKDLVSKYGSQSVVASVDYKVNRGIREVYTNNGLDKIDMNLSQYIDYLLTLNVGEIYLNSIDRDGTGFGYDIETIEMITDIVSVPLIIAGGAGNESHLKTGLQVANVNAVATANLFNFIGDGIPIARRNIIKSGIDIVNWE